MSVQLVENARVLQPGRQIIRGSVLLEGGRIAEVNPSSVPEGAGRLDCAGRLLTPGLIDLHTHGIHQHCYSCDQSPGSFAAALEALPRYGVTCVVPTIVPGEGSVGAANYRCLPALARSAKGGAAVAGFHLEGPFVAVAGAACATLPGDISLLDSMIDACEGRLRVMSISPEQKGVLPVIERLVERGIVPFITHTRASVDQTEAAIEAGARHATHFYDVFPAPVEAEPGVRPVGAVEAILADRRVSVDFICDGVHVHPAAIRAALAAKGWENVLLITDSNIGAGLPPGEHDTPWGYKVRVAPGDAARHASRGSLAGSALTMNVGIKNLLKWLDLPDEQVWAMGSLNPARLLGLENKGRIAAGADADLVLWDDDLKAMKVWVGGECVFDREGSLQPA